MTKSAPFDTELIADMFEYLDTLRQSGSVNMFGAGLYLLDTFEITKNESHDVLAAWQTTFGKGTSYERASKAFPA